MTAKQLYELVLSLFVIGIIEAFIKAFLATFPLDLLYGFEAGVLATIVTSKLINDTREMKYGIQTKDEGNNGTCKEAE